MDDPLPDLRNEDGTASTEDGIQFLPSVQDLFPAKEDAKKEPLRSSIGDIIRAKREAKKPMKNPPRYDKVFFEGVKWLDSL